MSRSALLPCLAASLLASGLAEAAPWSRGEPPVIHVANVAIEAPWTVDPGAKLEVAISGGSGGRLEIWGPITQHGRGDMLAGGAVPGNRVPITAPNAPGSYELRYLGPTGELLAQRSFEVAAVPIRLGLPLQLGVGAPGEVRWYGPASPEHLFQLIDPASGTVVASARGAETETGVAATMEAPGRAGKYRMRFVDTASGQVLSDLPFTVN